MTRIDLKTSKSIRLRTKGKYVAEDIDIVPNLETLNVAPTTAEQNFSVGSGFSGIGDVKVGAVNPADYYKPESVAEVTPTTQTQNIKPASGSVFNEVRVGAIQTEQTTIKTNGTHTPSAGKFFDKVVVAVDDIPAVLQEKTVTPTRQPQTVLPDTNYEGMSKVEVGGIPAEFIVPSGSITATENKTYDVTEVKQVVVAVPEKADAKLIEGSATKNGEYRASDFGADGFDIFTVNVEEKYKEPLLQNKEVTPTKETQIVMADAGYDGLNSTTVKPIPDEYIIPEGELTITENNKQFDVADKKTVTVNVPAQENEIELVEYTITQDTDLSGGNVEFLPKYDNIIDENLDLSTLTLDDCGQTYGFKYSTSTNRIEPLNKKKVNSFAYCKIRFTMKSDGGSLAVTIYQSSEVNYDYGFISKLDTDLNKNADGSDVNSVYNSKGLQGNYTYTFTDIPAGEHFFTFKYRKDTSNDTAEDTCAITNIHINDIDKLEADGFSKVTLEKPTDLESDNILSGKTVFGVEGNLVIADYQSTTATPQDVLLGKKFLSEEGVIIEGSVEEFIPASEYKTNVVLNTKGKIVSENITINVTAEGARDAKETMYEMQEADYMRYLQGQIGIYDIPSEAEYLEQQEYVNSAIFIIMGE